MTRTGFFAGCGLALLGCDKGGGGEAKPVGRSEQIIAQGPAASAPSPPPVDPHTAAASAPRPARKLCDGDGDSRGRTLPKIAASHDEAAGAEALDGTVRATPGQWTWINFWAGWCAPCREEIPRLLGWRDRLGAAGTPIHLVFVSIDDDERQLHAFLEAQPPGGLRSSLWLPDGKKRSAWLTSLRMESAPELPAHTLVDTAGHVRCFIQGAVEDGDYDRIAAILR